MLGVFLTIAAGVVTCERFSKLKLIKDHNNERHVHEKHRGDISGIKNGKTKISFICQINLMDT